MARTQRLFRYHLRSLPALDLRGMGVFSLEKGFLLVQ